MIPADPQQMPAYLESLDEVFEGLRTLADGAAMHLISIGEFEAALKSIGIENGKDSAAPPDANILGTLSEAQYAWVVVMARLGYSSHCKVMAKDKLKSITESN